MYAPDLNLCLKDGLTLSERGHQFKLSIRHVGDLVVTSGAILATDPFAPMDQAAFARRVTPGTYPVFITIATEGESQDVAFARIKLGDSVIARWEMALRPGEKTADLNRGEGFGYAVDTGTGCFMDLDQFEGYDKRLAGDESFGLGLIEKYREGATANVATIDYKFHCPAPGNIIMFSSGVGDGVYSSYWGLDASGEAAALVTSFDVVGVPDCDQVTAPRQAPSSGAKGWWRVWK